jgi:hypothetical protein
MVSRVHRGNHPLHRSDLHRLPEAVGELVRASDRFRTG